MDPKTYEWFKTSVWPIPFHRLLGLELESVEGDCLVARLAMHDRLQGNNGRNGAMHGGVVAGMLDTTCGYLAGIVATQRLREAGTSQDEISRRTSRMATIDMHVNYLRPLRSAEYVTTASISTAGSTIMRARAEVVNAEGEVVATATVNFSY